MAFSLRKSHLARHSTLHVYWKNALEPICRGSDHVAGVSVIAGGESGAGCDVTPVGEIRAVDAEESMAIAEAEPAVEQRVVVDEEGVGGVGSVGAHEANSEVAAETGKPAAVLGVVGEGADLVAGCLRQPFANVRGGDVFEIVGRGEGVSAVEIEAVGEAGDAFELDAAGADFAVLVLVVAAVGDQDVSLVDLED